MVMLRVVIRKLQMGLSVLATRGPDHSKFDEEVEVPSVVPDDVKEGHFAVFAVKGTERKRFVVELEYLSSPAFLRLLEQAKEEYGFRQKGALSVPCRPEDLQKILQDKMATRACADPKCSLHYHRGVIN
ncbi:hypothetical protein FNV43_RR15744 [Rhamnella rubrinervis]|uniref:Uncharacterized protein n=1 Tax=Rhamnella rubrinervis TaxID=2594499 RepID=A0A8K0E9H1_9ROSA|nr:hypothetical protein FNV43_RR15744 [Rhamnella rubrinervis]